MAYSRCSINNNWLMDKSMNGWGIMTLYALDGVYVYLAVYEERMTDFRQRNENQD